MKILLVAATDAEVSHLLNEARQSPHAIDVMVTGVGMTATTYALTKRLSKNRYQYVINVGLAGSFRDEIAIGEVVNVISDTFADLGAEDDADFLSVFELGLHSKDEFPYWNGKIKNDTQANFPSLQNLKKVKAITVNKVHGSSNSILRTTKKYQPDIESMEGAAVFYVCMLEKQPFIQLRAISNKVEKRNREAWNIPFALDSMKKTLLPLLSELK